MAEQEAKAPALDTILVKKNRMWTRNVYYYLYFAPERLVVGRVWTMPWWKMWLGMPMIMEEITRVQVFRAMEGETISEAYGVSVEIPYPEIERVSMRRSFMRDSMLSSGGRIMFLTRHPLSANEGLTGNRHTFDIASGQGFRECARIIRSAPWKLFANSEPGDE